jgi:hypothetical protein
MSITMTHGSQGIVCILQEIDEHGREMYGEGGREEAQVEGKEGQEGEVVTTEVGRQKGGGGGGSGIDDGRPKEKKEVERGAPPTPGCKLPFFLSFDRLA